MLEETESQSTSMHDNYAKFLVQNVIGGILFT